MKKKILIIVLLITSISLMACSNEANDREIGEGENPDLIEVNVEARELLSRSEKISNLVVELYGIDDATTIVFNDEAYLGVVMAFDQEYTEELKNLILQQVKEKDELIKNVFVTNDDKLFRQLDDVVFNLLQGESYDSQVKEINKIADKMKN